MAEDNRFKKFVEQHKEEIIIAGVTITAVVGAVLIAKNFDILKKQLTPSQHL